MFSIAYEPVDGPNDIRIVELQPGPPDAAIQCQIVAATLDDQNAYQALSYTWGRSLDGLKQILVNDQLIRVGINLYDALKALRSASGQIRRIWIDNICINQADEEERSHHVQRMGEIYSHAEKVVIWLGRESGNSDLAMAAMARIFQFRSGCPLVPVSRRLVSDFKRHRAAWTAIGKLFGREYWQRMWIIQEVQLANVLHVHCGTKSIAWEVLQSTLDFANICLECHDLKDEKVLLDVANSLAARLEAHRVKRQSHGSTLKELLQDCRTSLCSDQRDMVYALVGLARDCQHGALIVDYTKSVMQVYKDVLKLYTLHGHGDWSNHNGRDAFRFSKFLQDLLQVSTNSQPLFRAPEDHQDTVLIVGYLAGTIDAPRRQFLKTLDVVVIQNKQMVVANDPNFRAVVGRVPRLVDFPPELVREPTEDDYQVLQTIPQHVILDTGQAAVVPASATKGDLLCQFLGHETAFVLRNELGGCKLLGSGMLFEQETEKHGHSVISILEDNTAFQPKCSIFMRLSISIFQVLTS